MKMRDRSLLFLCILSYVRCNMVNIKKDNKQLSSPKNAYLGTINDHICGNDPTSTWCIPPDYSKNFEPWHFRDKINFSLPWYYYIHLDVIEIQDVSDIKQAVTIDLYYNIKWYEPRIILDFSSAGKRNGLIKVDKEDHINLPLDSLKYLWIPDPEIFGLIKYVNVKVLRPYITFRVNRDRKMRYYARTQIILSCHMTFENYPFDTHRCIFGHGSFTYSADILDCVASTTFQQQKQRKLQYQLEIIDLPQEERMFSLNGLNWTSCGFAIDMKREKTQILCQVYLTSTLLVILSWASFIIRPSLDIPGRMGLLVTLLLVLMNIFIGAKQGAPKSHGYLNALDAYLLVCIGEIFGAFFEYVIVLLYVHDNKKEIIKPLFVSSKKFDVSSLDQSNAMWNKMKMFATKCKNNVRNLECENDQNAIDRISLYLFPSVFVSFVIFYFYIHLN